MATEELGLEISVKGFAKFISDMKAADKATAGLATGWTKAGGTASSAMGKFTALSTSVGVMTTKTKAALEAVQPLGIAFSTAAASGALLISSSTMIAARNEELAIVLQTVGENAGYTETQLASYETAIKGLGITTQSARQAMVQMIQANIDLAHSTDLARLAQDAAVIAQVDSSEAFTRLITIIQTGNVLMGRRLGLNLDFANSNKLLAASLGITVDALTQEQRMQARVNEVMRQGERIAGTYEAAMGTTGKQLRSLNRLWEEARAALGEAFLPMLTRAVTVTGDVLKTFNNLDAGTQHLIGNLLGLGTAVAGGAGAFILITPRIIATAQAVSTMTPLVIDTGIALKALAAGTSAAEVASIGLSGVLAAVVIPIIALAAAVVALNAVMEGHHEKTITLSDSYERYVDMMRKTGRQAQILTEAQWEAARATEEVKEVVSLTVEQLEAANAVTDGWAASLDAATREAGDAADGFDSLDEGASKATTALGGAAQAAKDVDTAVGDLDGRMRDLADAIAGPVGEENAKYHDAQADIRARIDETKQAIIEAQEEFGIASEEAATHRAKLNDLKRELGELGTAHRETMNRIVYDLLIARLATDGWTEAEVALALKVAEGMGLIDEETADAAEAMNDALTEFATGEGQAQTLATIEEIATELAGLPRDIQIEVHTTYYEHYAEAAREGGGDGGMQENYQRGTPFVPRTGPAVLHRGEAVLPVGAARAYRQNITNTSLNFNLTTQSTTRPGGLAMEFGAMAFAGAGASR